MSSVPHDPRHLVQPGLPVPHVSQPEGHRDHVETSILEGKIKRITHDRVA
jgi:hypothetical protein